jgi:hypothetical protein
VEVEEWGKDARSDSEERATIRETVVKQIMKWAG